MTGIFKNKCLDFLIPKKNRLYVRKTETSFFKDGDYKKEFSIEKCVTSQGQLNKKFIP